jgi:hypothetical protein
MLGAGLVGSIGCYDGLEQGGVVDGSGGSGDGGGSTGGGSDDSDAGPPESCADNPEQYIERRIRVLNSTELANTVRDLTGIADYDVPPALDLTEIRHRYHTDAQANRYDAEKVAAWHTEAVPLAQRTIAEQAGRVSECDPGKTLTAECREQFISGFMRRAFRRDLSADEHDAYLEVYDTALAQLGSAEDALMWTIVAVLESPSFLYRTELGVDTGADDLFVLTHYEVASVISYLVTRSMPDEALLAAAAAEELHDPAKIRDHGQRLLAESPRGADGVQEFFRHWLQLSDVSTLDKDPVLFPEFTPEVRDAVLQEADLIVGDVVLDEAASWAELLGASIGYINQHNAFVYGMEATGDVLTRVALEGAQQRNGVLTIPAIMARLAAPGTTSPTHRGLWVRSSFLCQAVPPPPDVDTSLPKDPPDQPTSHREKLERHIEDPACSPCHMLMDPIGFGFDRLDAVGAFRDLDEVGEPVDDSGTLQGAGAIDGPFRGTGQLAAKLADSVQAKTCLTTHVYTFAMGLQPTDDQRCHLESMGGAFLDDGAILSMFESLSDDSYFLIRRRPQ